ncbi:group II intron maturase-specific domain-containing protein [Paraburkholderia sp. BL9I2N2]|uniref:group II intron maturase-specific domain-containing protein n=1 Tax=Paraburkholderia sp. BL9I2N2 TaxID=1938809 RepID=UPI001FB2F20D|nr:group II intron maturase-specific domain-containing protein [Paraburkholderia sp. BL9I2N2]
MKEIARASDVVDHNRFFAEYLPIQTEADASHLPPGRAVTALIFAICGWSFIEAPFECGASSGDTWLLALVVAKLIIIAVGVAAIANVRFARGIFAFWMRQVARGWRLQRQTSKSLFELAPQCNPTICGWWNYYGAFYRTAMHELSRYLDRKLVRWVRHEYKTLRRHKRCSEEWLRKMKKAYPREFAHWQYQGGTG